MVRLCEKLPTRYTLACSFAYRSTLVPRKDFCSLLYRIFVAKHCIFAPPFSFMPPLIGKPVAYVAVFDGSTSFANLGDLLPVPTGAQLFLRIVGFGFIVRGSISNLGRPVGISVAVMRGIGTKRLVLGGSLL